MKITDFGLWFSFWNYNTRIRSWSTTIPQAGSFFTLHDGWYLGYQDSSFDLTVYQDTPCIIQLKNSFPKTLQSRKSAIYFIGRLLTLDDFEIIPNPNYVGGL
jgi:hypothetical protein